MKRIYIIIASLLALTACQEKGNTTATEQEKTEPTEQVADTTTTTATADSAAVDAVTSATHVANSPTFNGLMIVSPDKQATVSSTLGGRIHSLRVLPGKSIAQGQVVATLDNPAFIELQQTYLESVAQLEYLEKEYQRQRSLGSQEAASQKRVQHSTAEWPAMRSKATAAAVQLHALGIKPQTVKEQGIQAYLPVKAPLSGFVTNMNANLGKYMEAGAPICDIINKQHPLLQLTVYEKDLHLIEVGEGVNFRINGLGKSTFQATVISIDQSVDKSDYSIKVYARVNQTHPSFRPGMYVRAKLRKTQ